MILSLARGPRSPFPLGEQRDLVLAFWPMENVSKLRNMDSSEEQLNGGEAIEESMKAVHPTRRKEQLPDSHPVSSRQTNRLAGCGTGEIDE